MTVTSKDKGYTKIKAKCNVWLPSNVRLHGREKIFFSKSATQKSKNIPTEGQFLLSTASKRTEGKAKSASLAHQRHSPLPASTKLIVSLCQGKRRNKMRLVYSKHFLNPSGSETASRNRWRKYPKTITKTDSRKQSSVSPSRIPAR